MSRSIQVNEATKVATMLIAAKADLTNASWLLQSVVEAEEKRRTNHERSCSLLTALANAKVDLEVNVKVAFDLHAPSTLLSKACDGRFRYPLKLVECLLAHKVCWH